MAHLQITYEQSGVFPGEELCNEIAGASQVVVLLEPGEAHFRVRLVPPRPSLFPRGVAASGIRGQLHVKTACVSRLDPQTQNLPLPEVEGHPIAGDRLACRALAPKAVDSLDDARRRTAKRKCGGGSHGSCKARSYKARLNDCCKTWSSINEC